MSPEPVEASALRPWALRQGTHHLHTGLHAHRRGPLLGDWLRDPHTPSQPSLPARLPFLPREDLSCITVCWSPGATMFPRVPLILLPVNPSHI